MKRIALEIDSSWAHRFWKKARRIAVNKSRLAVSDLAALTGTGTAGHRHDQSQFTGTRPELVPIYLRRRI